MKNIMKLNLGGLPNREHEEFLNRVLTLVTRYGAAALNVEKTFTKLTTLHEEAKAARAVVQKSAITEDVRYWDKQRNIAFWGLYLFIASERSDPNDERRKKSKQLLSYIRKAGCKPGRKISDVRRLNMKDKTAAIESIIAYAKKLYQPCIQQLDPIYLRNIKRLSNANALFSEQLRKRKQEWATRGSRNVGKVRKEIVQVYRDLIEELNAFVRYNDYVESYNTFVHEMNVIISDFRVLLAGRRTRSKNQAAAEAEKPSDEQPVTTDVAIAS